MCGITGFVGAGTEADLRRMADSLAHRGPDDAGYWMAPTRPVFEIRILFQKISALRTIRECTT